MEAETKAEKSAGERGKNLKTDPSFKASEQNTPALKDAINSTKEDGVEGQALLSEKGLFYPTAYSGHCYPGSLGSFIGWDDQGYFLGTNGLEIQQQAFLIDNGSGLYNMPGVLPVYSTYNSFLPGTVVRVDEPYVGRLTSVPSSMFPQPLLSTGHFSHLAPNAYEFLPMYGWDSSYLCVDGFYGNEFIVDSTIAAPKCNLSQSYTVNPGKDAVSSKSVPPSEKGGSSPVQAESPSPHVHSPSSKPANKVATSLLKGYFPISRLPSYPIQAKDSLLYPRSHFNVKENGQRLVRNDKLKSPNKLVTVGDMVLPNEQNHGLRTNNPKVTWDSGSNAACILNAEDGDRNTGSTDIVVKREDYNVADFPTKYDHAFFFVIKSYSEDDIHNSIKYKVWTSTLRGNRKLDDAFRVAQEKMEKDSKCPVFLFFSINASGQFCGVAEMIGRVDFSRNMDFWQQNKWNGFFPVKWHIIKNVPNQQFRRIILENNDNKCVTNSRDAQVVRCPQGIQMLSIFKNFSSKTSLLDDFDFCENWQKATLEKRSTVPVSHLEILSAKVGDAVPVEKADGMEAPVSGLEAIELGAAKKTPDAS